MLICLLSCCLLLGGCETLGYYGQAAVGQMGLLFQRRDLDAVLADPATSDELRSRLELARRLVGFAEQELDLAAHGRYRTVVELDDRFVVWNLYAAPRFALEPVQWCYPVAGCVSYRGYFEEAAALRKAARMAEAGFDVHVGGVAAYSTLGWFDDPLLSSFLQRSETDLAELLFHELTHGRLYVPGDTAFNESLATFVARLGVRRWLASTHQESLRIDWEARHRDRQAFVDFVLVWRQRLGVAYDDARARDLDVSAMEELRESLWREMRRAWLDSREERLAAFDGFFMAEPSNARLNTVADYNVWVPAMERLYRQLDRNLPALLQRCDQLAALAPAERRAALDAL